MTAFYSALCLLYPKNNNSRNSRIITRHHAVGALFAPISRRKVPHA